jgi:hypothetical protein
MLSTTRGFTDQDHLHSLVTSQQFLPENRTNEFASILEAVGI